MKIIVKFTELLSLYIYSKIICPHILCIISLLSITTHSNILTCKKKRAMKLAQLCRKVLYTVAGRCSDWSIGAGDGIGSVRVCGLHQRLWWISRIEAAHCLLTLQWLIDRSWWRDRIGQSLWASSAALMDQSYWSSSLSVNTAGLNPSSLVPVVCFIWGRIESHPELMNLLCANRSY